MFLFEELVALLESIAIPVIPLELPLVPFGFFDLFDWLFEFGPIDKTWDKTRVLFVSSEPFKGEGVVFVRGEIGRPPKWVAAWKVFVFCDNWWRKSSGSAIDDSIDGGDAWRREFAFEFELFEEDEFVASIGSFFGETSNFLSCEADCEVDCGVDWDWELDCEVVAVNVGVPFDFKANELIPLI